MAGCNLFLFNYAGYGRSSGKPTPNRVSQAVRLAPKGVLGGSSQDGRKWLASTIYMP